MRFWMTNRGTTMVLTSIGSPVVRVVHRSYLGVFMSFSCWVIMPRVEVEIYWWGYWLRTTVN